MLELVMWTCEGNYNFDSFEGVNPWFKELINLFKQMNYSEFESEDFFRLEKQIRQFVEEKRVK
jgi:V/A-type H+/Na+-transporting ATPase subunit A